MKFIFISERKFQVRRQLFKSKDKIHFYLRISGKWNWLINSTWVKKGNDFTIVL